MSATIHGVCHLERSDLATARPFLARATSAVRRRARAAWRTVSTPRGPSSVAAALDSLARFSGHTGLSLAPGGACCPTLTAAAIPTLLALGERAVALRWLEWLLSLQCADGAFPSVANDVGSLSSTAEALGALLAFGEADISQSTSSAERAAAWLASRIDAMGRFDRPNVPLTSIDHWGAPAIQVVWLPVLRQASQRFGAPAWRRAAERASEHLRRSVDWSCFGQAAHMHARAVDAWLAFGELELARDAMRWPAAFQCRAGAVPDEPGGRWICSAALAQFAVVWYKLADRARAERALACVQSRQLPTGGFPEGWSARGGRLSRRESAWACKHFLDASLTRVRASFEQNRWHLPDHIERTDGRFQAMREWRQSLGPAAKIADIGCGSGRFIRELAALFPAAKLVAVDPSQSALESCIEAAERRQGSLLRIPAGDGEFDGAMAVESLEHSLLPERAVRELCRVVRPGGRIVIIDKHRAKQRLSEHEPWEQWFLPEIVSAWLARDCRTVTARAIAHGRAVAPDGLFWCWEATR